jgi:hypothetical protein
MLEAVYLCTCFRNTLAPLLLVNNVRLQGRLCSKQLLPELMMQSQLPCHPLFLLLELSALGL